MTTRLVSRQLQKGLKQLSKKHFYQLQPHALSNFRMASSLPTIHQSFVMPTSDDFKSLYEFQESLPPCIIFDTPFDCERVRQHNERPSMLLSTKLEILHEDLLVALQQSNLDTLETVLFTVLKTLENHRLSLSSDKEWKDWIINEFRNHPLFTFLQTNDPIVRRSMEKPRGYAGDAGLLDLLQGYNGDDCDSKESSMLKQLSQKVAPVGKRTEYFGRFFDSLLSNVDFTPDGSQWSALSVASGHCRETEYSELLKDESINSHINVVAFDNDQLSLDVVNDRSEAAFNGCLQSCKGSIRKLLNPKFSRKLLKANNNGEKFDYVYTMGVYDYLNDASIVKLTSILFNDYLQDGGTLVFGNMVDGVETRGYMEALMDWWLLYRSEAQLKNLVNKAIPQSQISHQSYTQINGYIIVSITKSDPKSQ